MFKTFKRFTTHTLGRCLLIALCAVATTANANRLEEIKSRGRLICATLSGTEPLAFQDPRTRQYMGFDIDLCNALAKRFGVTLEHKPVAVEARIPS
ncbi:transporter substrate-binding domain-containing protein [Achromobacter spanius]|nr:transporter substrate-binding domain-containing protein [Achromobacter spanius]WAI82025.1 transporter substrate-binding domain-containing protein [Achromobacter spanius]